MSASDEELIERCKKGDVTAFDRLYKKYSAPLTNYIFKLLADFDRAEDLFQETFVRVLTKSHYYRPRAKFSTWVYKIATNLCYNELRRRRQLPTVPLDDCIAEGFEKGSDIPSDPNQCPLRRVENRDLYEKVLNAMRRLPVDQRTVFSLRFYQELPYDQIAEILNCPLGTVKSRMHNAVRKLQNLLKDGKPT